MVGALMAAARPGRSRPEPHDVLDLVKGAAATWVRWAFGAESVARWRDAMVVVARLLGAAGVPPGSLPLGLGAVPVCGEAPGPPAAATPVW